MGAELTFVPFALRPPPFASATLPSQLRPQQEEVPLLLPVWMEVVRHPARLGSCQGMAATEQLLVAPFGLLVVLPQVQLVG